MSHTRLRVIAPQETTERLENPGRGFYTIRSYTLCDDMDAESVLAESFRWDDGERLTLAEFNLCRYREGEISPAGLENLSGLFAGLRVRGKELIVRFVYDLDGKNLQTEPPRRAVIERHMAQVGELVRRYSNCIFTLQGLFTGNWGEMNGTRYNSADDLRALARCLADAAGESAYLAVRTPAQWRTVTGGEDSALARRLGLFNDGMLGSAGDLGTYGERRRAEAGYGEAWCREDELAFQNELCRRVPNGGEAVGGAELSEFSQAMDALRRMRVSYLDRDYDRAALDKWAAVRIHGGIWDGVDGLSYIEAHLGYRFVLGETRLSRTLFGNRLRGTVTLKNIGFAPIYGKARAELVLADAAGRELRCVPLAGDPRTLSGGAEKGGKLRFDFDLAPEDLTPCRIFFRLYSETYGREILLGSTGREPGLGYCIGRIDGT